MNLKTNYPISEALCEFYGILIGDGCISRYVSQDKTHFEIRIEGNALTDYAYYVKNLRSIILEILGKSPKIYFRKDCNGISVSFHAKDFAIFLNENLGFPFGKKKQISIHNSLLKDQKKMIAIIRGIFDTDGSLYFTKNDYFKKRSYPIIEIVSISRILLEQMSAFLASEGFVVKTGHGGNSIKLHGKKNLKMWMDFIGTSHIDKLSKFLFWQKYGECPTNEELPLNKRLRKLDMGP